jgi:hypothetical protein
MNQPETAARMNLFLSRVPETMSKPEQYQIFEGHAEFRPAGHMPLSQAVQLVTMAITFTREQNITKLLIDTTGLTGFESPSVAARYFFMKEWAYAAGGLVCIAMVAQPEMIDPQKFGVTVGANLGLQSNVFASEEEALAWLRDPRPH